MKRFERSWVAPEWLPLVIVLTCAGVILLTSYVRKAGKHTLFVVAIRGGLGCTCVLACIGIRAARRWWSRRRLV